MDALTTDEVADLVYRHLQERQPLSAIRIGDGESRLMGFPEHTSRRDLDLSLRFWFGRNDFTDAQLVRLARELRDACTQADIVGVPTKSQAQKAEGWANVEKYLHHYDLLSNGTCFADCNLHWHLLEAGAYDDLLHAAERVHLVTCRSLAQAMMYAFHLGQAPVWHPLPEEANTGQLPTMHFPWRYESMRGELDRAARLGRLFLVGAGALGKIYCAWIRDAGGVALDVGSVFDAWAGVPSRSGMRKDPKSYEKYRLPAINLHALYEERCGARTDIAAHLPRLYNLVVSTGAQQVIELGVRGGESSVALLAGLHETGGRLWSCDIEAVGMPAVPLLGRVRHWDFVQGDDRALLAEAPAECDILFIDSSHEHEHTLWELEHYGSRVRSGGYIVLHDTELEPIQRALREYLADEDRVLFVHPESHGLGVMRV